MMALIACGALSLQRDKDYATTIAVNTGRLKLGSHGAFFPNDRGGGEG